MTPGIQASREDTEGPLVSVVVPTTGRSPWLKAAVESVLRQSYENCEVLVVDDSTAGLRGLAVGTNRARLIRSGSVGGASARNVGVAAARGEWIAFLDDDDEWMPHKLAMQMHEALASDCRFPVLTSRLMVRTARSEYVFPRQAYQGGESIEEYLFCRKGWATGSGYMQTSTLLAKRELLLRVPFAPGLVVHQDWDWLLRVSRDPDVEIGMLAEPLVVYRTEDGRATVSRQADWRTSLEWIREHKHSLKPKALSWFVAVQCVWKARAAHAGLREWVEIAKAFFFEGRPTVLAAVHFAGFAVIPPVWRKRVRDWAWRRPGLVRARREEKTWKLEQEEKALG